MHIYRLIVIYNNINRSYLKKNSMTRATTISNLPFIDFSFDVGSVLAILRCFFPLCNVFGPFTTDGN